MAHPADPAHKGASPFAGARLAPEELERLAATFRPSWELDDAPFTGPGSLSPSEIQVLQGGGTHADVLATAHAAATNGAHAPAAPAPVAANAAHEPENSVIIDRSITADQIAPPPPKLAPPVAVAPPPPAVVAPPAGPTGTVVLPPDQAPRIPQRPAAPAAAPASRRPPPPQRRTAPSGAPARARAASVDVEEPVFPKKSNKGLFIGLGAVAALLVVGGVYMAVSGSSADKAAAPVPTSAETKANDKTAAIPPPPPETTTAAPAAPPATTTAQEPPATATATPASPAPPEPAPVPRPRAPAAAHAAASPPPRSGPAPRAKKSGQTIVRDVPF